MLVVKRFLGRNEFCEQGMVAIAPGEFRELGVGLVLRPQFLIRRHRLAEAVAIVNALVMSLHQQ